MLTQREKTLCRLALSVIPGITAFTAALSFGAPLWFFFVLMISHTGVWLVGMFEGGTSVPLCDKEHVRT